MPAAARPAALRAVAGCASVALGGRAVPGAGRGHQVVGPVLPGRLRPDDGLLGHGRAPRRRRSGGGGSAAVVKDGLYAAAVMVGVAVLTYVGVVGRLVPLPRRLRPHVGAPRTPSTSFGWVPAPLRSLWHYHREMYQFNVTLSLAPPVQDEPLVVAGPGPADVVLLRGPEEGARRLHGRAVLQGDHLDRHRRRCGGAARSRSSSCCSCGRCAATGAPGRSSPASPAATCPGSTTRAARSTRSTRSPSCRTSCWPSPTSSGWSSGRRRRRHGGAAGGWPWPAGTSAVRGAVRVLLPAVHRAGHPLPAVAAADVVPQLDLSRVSAGRAGTARAAPAWSPRTTRTASCGSTSRTT